MSPALLGSSLSCSGCCSTTTWGTAAGYRRRNGRTSRRTGVRAEQQIVQAHIRWETLFTYRTMWAMILGFFCTVWIWNIFLNFLPLYPQKTYRVTLSVLGVYAPWVGGIIRDIFGGCITKRIADAGVASPMNAKRAMIIACAILAAISVILVPLVHSLAFTFTPLTLALAFMSAITGSFRGDFSPFTTGRIADSTESYSLASISGGIIAGCAAVCYWFIVKNDFRRSTGMRGLQN